MEFQMVQELKQYGIPFRRHCHLTSHTQTMHSPTVVWPGCPHTSISVASLLTNNRPIWRPDRFDRG